MVVITISCTRVPKPPKIPKKILKNQNSPKKILENPKILAFHLYIS